MLRSLFSGISGLRQHQTLMDVVSNNIANVNTTGFKGSSVIFEDTLSQIIKASAAPTATAGGLNAAQVGLGVQLGAISTNFAQGSAQNTGKSTDLMIQGDGFFVVRNGIDQEYTRAGSFTFDTNGNLVTPTGAVVRGWQTQMKDSAGNLVLDNNGQPEIDTTGTIGDIKIQVGQISAPTATSTVTTGGNILPSVLSSASATPLTLGATVYDKAGTAHDVTITLTPNSGAGKYDVTVADNTDPSSTGTAGVLKFTSTGAYDATNSTAPAITLADGSAIAIDMTGITSYGGTQSLAVTKTNGWTSGNLQQFQINADGTIMGMFSNGQRQPLGVLAIANFNNPMGLEKVGDTSFRTSTNSGLAQIGTPGSAGRGTLLGGSLEMSNVDLAQEFSNLIIAQRGFQANSRVITTSDQMLQDLVDIKR